jgi:hypothetical protein
MTTFPAKEHLAQLVIDYLSAEYTYASLNDASQVRALNRPGERVGVGEVVQEVLEVGVPVSGDRGLGALEHLPVDAFGVVSGH